MTCDDVNEQTVTDILSVCSHVAEKYLGRRVFSIASEISVGRMPLERSFHQSRDSALTPIASTSERTVEILQLWLSIGIYPLWRIILESTWSPIPGIGKHATTK